MLHIIRSVSSGPEHIDGIFIALACQFQKLLPKTAGDLSWPEVTSGTLGGVTNRNFTIQSVCLKAF